MPWYVTYRGRGFPLTTEIFPDEESAQKSACAHRLIGRAVLSLGSQVVGEVKHRKLDAAGIEQMCEERSQSESL